LFNEPNLGTWDPTNEDWSCLENGCATSYDGVSYQSAGMQQLVNVVRAAGATQPLMVSGLIWADDLCGTTSPNITGGCAWLNYEPTDPLHQLVASFHSYNTTACNTESCWNSDVGTVAATAPVVTGELGESDCSSAYMTNYENWADANNISYLSWSWNPFTPGMSCTASDWSLLSNWNGTPSTNSPQGAAYQAHLDALEAGE